jgi:glutamyl-tRNA reductase
MIVVVGVSHRTSPLALREALAFPKETLPDALGRLREQSGAEEAMILSTCNRVELYAGGIDDPAPVAAFLAEHHGRGEAELREHAYRLAGEDAVRHAFRVAASLDSMVVGEAQILGQVKEAYELAEAAGALGSTLATLRHRSFAAAKRARSETGIGRNAVSVSSVAVELALKIFGELKGRAVLLVGAGKMSALAARQLVASGATASVLGGRTFEKADLLARALGGRAAPLEKLRDELARADIVISGTGAPGTVISRADVAAARQARGGRPLFLVDIAVPRDVEPEARDVPGVFLYDLDDLKAVSEANLRERRKEAVQAEQVVEHEVREYLDWLRSREVAPLLAELRRRGEEIRRAEIEKARRRLGTLTPEQEQALEAATAAIVNKLLHAPTVQLKEAARDGRGDMMGLIRRVLGL